MVVLLIHWMIISKWESIVLETLKKFVTTIISVFGEEWLRPPSEEEVQRILQHNESHGFSSMLGSIDCMH
jgi:hypothetical protein